MGVALGRSAAWELDAIPSAVPESRRRATAFVTAAGAPREVVQAVALGVSEAVTNAVVHAYRDRDQGRVRVSCRAEDDRFVIEVSDDGPGIGLRRDSPGIGQGLAMVGAVAQALAIDSGAGGAGTSVTMTFGPAAPESVPPDLESLCAIALDTVADVSCVDRVAQGVLRRVGADVRGDPESARWLRDATPPTKPGTATWEALRGGGARLVVHDPTAPRSPTGPGERLRLTWWIAVGLDTPDGTPMAIWGLGGRSGGRPVPGATVLGVLTDASHRDLQQPAERAVLRARLATA